MGDGESKIAGVNCMVADQVDPDPHKQADYEIINSPRSDQSEEWSASTPVWDDRVPCDTLFILDWDDTLLCTTAINRGECDLAQLHDLEVATEALLLGAMRMGETVIVTSSSVSWVLASARKYMPSLVPILEGLTVISARSKYEELYPENPFAWKSLAFQQVLRCRRAGNEECGGVNLLVLGDSLAEMAVARCAWEALGEPSLVKAVKFVDSPAVPELIGQLRMVELELPRLVGDGRSLALALERCRLPGGAGALATGESRWTLAACSERFWPADGAAFVGAPL